MFPPVVRVAVWSDPVVERVGFPVRGAYMESVWLPVVGPSVAWALRRLGTWAAPAPDGVDVPLAALAEAIGLSGRADARSSPMQRTLLRMVRFGLAEWSGSLLRVRTSVPPVGPRHLARLSPRVQRTHERLIAKAAA